MSVFIGGIVSIIIFYVLILAVGIWAGKKQKSTEKNPDTEEIMLAGRNIGLIVGIFTMTGKKIFIFKLRLIFLYQILRASYSNKFGKSNSLQIHSQIRLTKRIMNFDADLFC